MFGFTKKSDNFVTVGFCYNQKSCAMQIINFTPLINYDRHNRNIPPLPQLRVWACLDVDVFIITPPGPGLRELGGWANERVSLSRN